MKKRITLFVLCTALLCLSACASETGTADSTATSESVSEMEIHQEVSDHTESSESESELQYQLIMESEHMDLETAYDRLAPIAEGNGEAQELMDTIALLQSCEGYFVQEKTSEKEYGADVTFYLKKGNIYCAVEYNNFTGTLADGVVQETSEPGFLFEAFPQGVLVSRALEFSLYFSPNRLHILWGGSSDYMLSRAETGAARETVEPEKPAEAENTLEDSAVFQKVKEIIDRNFSDTPHSIAYDAENRAAVFYVEAPESTRRMLTVNRQAVLEAWDKLVGNIQELSSSARSAFEAGGYEDHAVLYLVDKLNEAGIYSEDDYLLIVDNGTVQFDYAEEAGTTTAPETTPSDSAAQSATAGEKNALSKAKEYLDFMAFSHDGLVEQLEYEGFSYSEAVYGADHCGADWMKQAVKKAKEYLDFMSFSREGLIEQLEYEGFTHEQAVYGAEQNGF